MANKDLEKTVKEILQNSKTKAKRIGGGWLYEVDSKGNPYEDFRDEYEKADMIDDRVAKRALPDRVQEEKYFVVMSNKELKKSKLKEIHNTRFAEYAKNDLIVKNKEDVVAELMNKYGIKPDFPSRPQTSPQIPEIPEPEQPTVKYGFPGPFKPPKPKLPGEDIIVMYGIPPPNPKPSDEEDCPAYPPNILYGIPSPTPLYSIPYPIKPKPTIKYGFLPPWKPTVYRYGIIGKRQKKN